METESEEYTPMNIVKSSYEYPTELEVVVAEELEHTVWSQYRYDCAIVQSEEISRLNDRGRSECSAVIPVSVSYPVNHSDIVSISKTKNYGKVLWPKVVCNIRDVWVKWCVRCKAVYEPGYECCDDMVLWCPEPKPTEIDLIISHYGCTDGRGSIWAVHRLFCKLRGHSKAISSLRIVEAKHETKSNKVEEIVNACRDRNVLIADFAFPPAQILAIKKICKKFILLDHHNSNKLSLTMEPNCYFDLEHSGAFLVWAYMVTSVPLQIPTDMEAPKIIQYIQDRDIWKFELPHSREISTAIRIHVKNTVDDFDAIDDGGDQMLESLAEKGKLYMLAQNFNIDGGNVRGVHMTTFMGLDAVVINTNESPSDVADAILNNPKYRKHRLAMIISWRPKLGCFKINLRSRESDQDLDVGFIASYYWEGGGHPQAAGFTIPTNVPINVIFERYPSYCGIKAIPYTYKSVDVNTSNDFDMERLVAVMTQHMCCK